MERYDGHGGIECIEAIKSALSYEEFRGFCKGNIMKYCWREDMKGGVVDIVKLQDYADYLIEADLEHIDALSKDANSLAEDCTEVLRKIMEVRSDA